MKNENEIIKNLDLGLSKAKALSVKRDNLINNIKANIANKEMEKNNIKERAKNALKESINKEII